MSRFTITSGSLAAAVLCAVLVPAVAAQAVIQTPKGATPTTAKASQGTTEAAANRPSAPLPAVRVLEPTGKKSHAVVITPNGKSVIIADDDGAVRMLEFATGKEERVFRGHTGPVPGVAISGDGRFIATVGSDKTARVFEVATGKEVVKRDFRDAPACVWINMDGTRVLTCSGRDIVIWSPTNEPTKNLVTLTGHTDAVTAVAADPKGSVIVSGAKDRTVCVWEPATGKLLHTFANAHQGDIKSIAVDAAGKHAISGGADMVVVYWDIANKKEIKRYSNLREPVEAVTLSSDSKRALAAGMHRLICFDPEIAADIAEFAPYRYANLCAIFQNDGRTVIVGGDQDTTAAPDKRGTVRVYEVPASTR